MTAVLGTLATESVTLDPTVAQATVAPLSAQAADYAMLVATGTTPVDVRSQRKRDADGVLSGALAIDAAEILTRLTPGTDESLTSADADARWLLISDDGHEAEWLAWHLQARGITGAVFVVGGFRALRRARVVGTISEQELAAISAH
ncbi:rhodanese-like domain-containing protein [Gordonia sp. LSe1-13]|uniref:Rhodanese-like domain-containing protein n=1 Tax=Gordonia sesuvii TaxID=3116777 RepID=A0ABU7MKT8_9ACTN|nr:rhodanese-like domain-containing protein [Gordonia sp. LSe1-13]